MKKIIFAIFAIFFSFTFEGVIAGEYTVGDLKIQHPRVRMILSSRPGAVYMKIENTGNVADKVISASSDMAKRIELHSHIMTDGIMKMRQIDSLDIPANSTIELKPGGLHLMVFGLKSHLKVGDEMSLNVVFEKAGTLEIKAPIESMKKMKMKMKMKHKMKHKTTN